MWNKAQRAFNFSSLFKRYPMYKCRSKETLYCTVIDDEYIRNNSTTRKLIQTALEELLNIRPIKALEIVTSSTKFKHSNPFVITDNFNLCIDEDITQETILAHPVILTDEKLKDKINKIKLLPLNLNDSIILSQFTLQKLHSLFLYRDNLVLRIENLTKIFNIIENKACEILTTKPFLLSVPLSNIEEKMKLFKEFGIENDDILKDLWIFKYSDDFIKARIDILNEQGVKNVKTWMIRCPEETLLKHVRRETENRDILGEHSVAEYLSTKLNCNENIAKYLIKKLPQLESKSISNISETIDFLYKNEFTSIQICRVPKILLHSRKTTEKRIKELNALGKKHVDLYVLTKSQKQYMQHIDNLLKNKP